MTLAQIFWIRDVAEQPARIFVVADRALSIAEHFAQFGVEMKDLRKRLRALPEVEMFETFPPYGAAYRRRFGIENEQALDLFNQTVSMKSVGNLTVFVREHMLETFPMEPRIDALLTHFDDLNRAHEAVLKAKDQIGRLGPLIADCDTRAALLTEVDSLRGCRGALRPWFASLKRELLSARVAKLDAEIAPLAIRIEKSVEKQRAQRLERDDLKRAIAENGGDRIERIKSEVAAKTREKNDRLRRAQSYDTLARTVELSAAADEEAFSANSHAIIAKKESNAVLQAEKQNALTESAVTFRRLDEERRELLAEIQSLRERRSNISKRSLDLRDELCRSTGLQQARLPFAGELMQVLPEARDWEGTIERVLHNFGLSLLVPDEDYSAVAQWVERHHLNGRLVYYRVREVRSGERSHMTPINPGPASLLSKLVFKPDSPLYPWLEAEVSRRFDYACCDSLEMFRRERQAITRAGQVKSPGERHEKDDRYRIEDRSRYVLGWSNEAKLAALEAANHGLEKRLEVCAAGIADLQRQLRSLTEQLGFLQQLTAFQSFGDLDWKPLASDIAQLETERQELESNSDVLRTLESQLRELEVAMKQSEERLDGYRKQEAIARSKSSDAQAQIAEIDILLSNTPEATRTGIFPKLEAMRASASGERELTVESCDNRERDMREWLQAAIDAEDRKIGRLAEQIVKAMESYRTRYPLDTQEADASVAASEEYRAMLNRLRSDDLPRFETRFKELLNENTIREVANFQSQLNRERQTILERIERINRSLREIDYNPGRFIVLEAEANPDVDIRDFQQDLRACTEGALTGSRDEEYSESKFLQVKGIIDRFRGREGSAQADKRWKDKVTDVRYWFTFSASERWREDNRAFEHYTDSGGKSGGQKEKLAYTVLAAGLAYQFGLDWGANRLRSFRFVVIDEAFGRGSDESARYGLELFRKLNLQLLIVTPLQKIHVIEPFVASVGFVHNQDGRQSMLRNFTIEEYRAERAARSA